MSIDTKNGAPELPEGGTLVTWLPDLSKRSGPTYKRIAQALIDDIEGGVLKAGDRLPPNRELAGILGVTVGTISRGFGEVLRRGLLETGARRGTRIKDAATDKEHLHQNGDFNAQASAVVDLRGHQTAIPEWTVVVARMMQELSGASELQELLRYENAGGRLRHRQAGAAWLSRGEPAIDPDTVVVTDGAQHALLCALLAMCRPGDRIAAERLTYTGLKTLAPIIGAELVPIDIDEHGMLPSALSAAAELGLKALICVPNIQNPTATVMPVERRRELAALAKSLDLFIVEDDVYGALLPDHTASITSFAPERSLRITSFSKTLGPGLRLGYMQVPPPLTAAVIRAIRATTWMASPLAAEIATRLIGSGQAESLLKLNQAEIQYRNKVLQAELRGFQISTTEQSPHAWLRLPKPWTAAEFCRWAESMGFKLLPAEAFAIAPLPMEEAVRFSVSAASSKAELERFARAAAQVLARPGRMALDYSFA